MYLSRFGFRGRVYPDQSGARPGAGPEAYPDMADAARSRRIWRSSPCRRRRRPRPSAPVPRRSVKVAIVMASGFGETLNPDGPRDRRRHGRRRARRRHAPGRPELAGPRQFRHWRDRQLLDDVRRDGAGGRPGRHREPERRHERRALRRAARARTRHPPRARHRERCGHHARGAGVRGAAGSGGPSPAALHRVDSRRRGAGACRGVRARARRADRRGEVRAHVARRAGGPIAHRRARQRRSRRRCVPARARHLARRTTCTAWCAPRSCT